MDLTMSFLLLLWITTQFHLSPSHQLAIKDVLLDDDVADHVTRLARSAGADGYDIAFFHGPSVTSGEHKRLTKRDVEDHAAHPSTESRNFELHLTSGERLRMSLQKRSAMSPDVMVVERAFGREELRRPQVRDCFFSGGLEGEEGHASLSLCDGRMMGAIRTGKRDYEVHALPESNPLRALVTWTPYVEGKKSGTTDVIIPDENEIEVEAKKRSVTYKSATIEVGVYLDRFYLAKMEEKFKLSTTQQLTDLVSLKWSGVYALLSNPSVVGWNITIKVAHLEIWRESPSWYNETDKTIIGRMDNICRFTTKLPFDHIFLQTADSTPVVYSGYSYVGTMCDPRWRCSIAKGEDLNSWVEAHETGHSLGLTHDGTYPSCNPENKVQSGFMTAEETTFTDCYRPVLNKSLSTKTCLFTENVDISKYNSVNNVVPLYRGQTHSLNDQCRLVKGDGFEYFHSSSTKICDTISCIRKSPFGEIAQMNKFMGTPCGKEQMCFKGACVPWVETVNPNYVRPLVREGGWGPWSPSSSCNNTCGDAVSVSTRQCNRPVPYLAPFCNGSAVKAQMCPCRQVCSGESNVESELVKQRANAVCRKMKDSGASPHNLTGEGEVHSSKGEVNKCTVTCNLVKGTSTNRFLLQDGTPCWGVDTIRQYETNRGISWRCVQGRCLAFGCNGKTLGEGGGVEKDKCGVCGGDGSSCPK